MALDWTDTISTTAAALSAIAAGGAWWAAQRSSSTARMLTAIERDRRHEDLTPDIRLSLTGRFGDRGSITVHLAGPDSLGDLTSVALEIIDDDMDHRVLNPTPSLTQADVDAHVWGPFRFAPGIDGADQLGRRVAPVPREMGRGRPFAVERTRPGHWMEGMVAEGWQGRYDGIPIRLRITCRRGDQVWVLAREMDNPPIQ
ncbi:hypothetical protein OG369_30735 [Streptomyces sp. NBC_01221]|uniref:hypothetical protein n=1 Tax=unclassified Streptomyces TaxID=2593676 RepID=UPI0022509723|nr:MULTISPECIES: hypothetical protein [unclassified Streptomyces]MCX4790387.1 hypothetical protein [Streptomyces sp. NBC_01221]WSJ35302.1 hypothetical protein OG772_04000 [Streptomyces sp. NBC_01321]WSP58612.1 hypothetical protein OG306_32705 [Streptomyces sp. NBC_01241]WSU20810.1 hypothetical protein OG508_07285 [Streptomyces sp. NBC_01108]